VEKHADRLLKEAGAYGRFPTPIADLIAAAKLTIVEDEFLDESTLRQFLRKLAQRGAATLLTVKMALSKVLGLFDPHDRLVLIDKDVPKAKKPFIKLHETGHGFLPHQSGLFGLIHDCKETLDPYTTDLFEREANVFAVESLFQGKAFAAEAHAKPFSMKVPIDLARKFGGSNYASFRRYVDTNPLACCVVVLEPPVVGPDGQFRAEVRRIIVSKTFDVMYDSNALFPSVTSAHPLASAVPIGRRMTSARRFTLNDRNNDRRICIAEAFDTKHQVFLLLRDGGLAPTSSIVKPGSAGFSSTIRHLQGL
jgi:Zn-dependent peptidase ImmA (M78 family)